LLEEIIHLYHPWFSQCQKMFDPLLLDTFAWLIPAFSFCVFFISFFGSCRFPTIIDYISLSHSTTQSFTCPIVPRRLYQRHTHNEPLALPPVFVYLVICHPVPYLPSLVALKLRIVVERQYVFLCPPACSATRLEGWIIQTLKGHKP